MRPQPELAVRIVTLAEKARFALVCGFLISQAYLIPVLAIGPSWAIWPSLTDIVVLCMAGICVVDCSWRLGTSRLVLQVWQWTVVGLIGAMASYFLFTLWLSRMDPTIPFLSKSAAFTDANASAGKSMTFGMSDLYRIVQVLIVYRCAGTIQYNERRIVIIKRLSLLVFFLLCAGVQATYSGLVDPSTLAGHLPSSVSVAGQWANYMSNYDHGVGAVGYNHAYTAAQLLAAGALCLFFYRENVSLQITIITSLLVSSFASGGRACFVGTLCFLALFLGIRLQTFVLAAVCLLVVLLIASLHISGPLQYIREAADRQESITTSYDEDGFSGRTEIWGDRFAFVNSSLSHWVFGGGVGMAVECGGSAHLQFLQYLLETGIVGLAWFVCWQWKILESLWRLGKEARPLVWFCVGVLVSGLAQESLYPNSAFPNFLAFYVFIVVAGLKITAQPFRVQDTYLEATRLYGSRLQIARAPTMASMFQAR